VFNEERKHVAFWLDARRLPDWIYNASVNIDELINSGIDYHDRFTLRGWSEDSTCSCTANLPHTLYCLRRCTRAIRDTYVELEFSEHRCEIVPPRLLLKSTLRAIIFTNFYVNRNVLSLASSIRCNVCTYVCVLILFNYRRNINSLFSGWKRDLFEPRDIPTSGSDLSNRANRISSRISSRSLIANVRRDFHRAKSHVLASILAIHILPRWSIWMNPYIAAMNGDKLRSSAIAYIVLGIFDMVIFTRTRIIAWNCKRKFRFLQLLHHRWKIGSSRGSINMNRMLRLVKRYGPSDQDKNTWKGYLPIVFSPDSQGELSGSRPRRETNNSVTA